MRPINNLLRALFWAYCLQASLGNLAGADNPANAPADQGKVSAIEKAHDSLARGRAYLSLKEYEPARKEVVDALKSAPDDPGLREEGIKLWREIHQAQEAIPDRKNMAELDEAARLASEGKTAEAAAKVNQVLGATDDKKIMARASTILHKNYPTFGGLARGVWRDFFAVMGWMVTLAESLVILTIVYSLLWLMRKRSASLKKNKWWLGVIDDKTGNSVADFVINSFRRWRHESPSASGGLLRLGALQLPSSPALKVGGPEFDVAAALDSLKLQVGTVSVAGVAKAASGLRGWWNALRPTISGTAFTRGSEIVVHLVKRSANSDPAAVSASAPEIQKAAESASYQMYYLIAKQTNVSDAELNDKLRQGLVQLNQYISGRDPTQLQAAYDLFRGVLLEEPTHDEAVLYEGVALDLLERHDEAITRFAFLAKNTDDAALKQKAMYNEAVSRFRKYTPEDLALALKELDQIITGDESAKGLAATPIKAFAYAAKTSAVAHKFLFWQTVLCGNYTKDQSEVIKRKGEYKGSIEDWLTEVEGMIKKLEQVSDVAKTRVPTKDCTQKDQVAAQGEPAKPAAEAPGKVAVPTEPVTKASDQWDALTYRQLRWSIKNAEGNAYLNCAIGFYKPPDVSPDAPRLHNERLVKALEAFRECEVLLPAGVETLTNLATTLLSLSKHEEARRYAESAITLNPNYEYAYFRLAQSWDEENRRDEVINVLKRFPRSPVIPNFRELFNRYYVEPKSA